MSAQPPPNAPPPTYSDAMNYGDNAGYGWSDKPAAPPPVSYYPPAAPLAPLNLQSSPEEHPDNDTSYDMSEFGNVASFSAKAVRHAFIRKVYLILTAQLLVTAGFICLFLFVDDLRMWVRANQWFYYVSYGVFVVTMITLVCCPGFRRNYPWNFICLLVFTLAFSYMAGTIASTYTTDSVLVAAGITAAVCLAITCFAMQTKIDFTMCSGLIFAFCMVFIFFGFAVLITYLTVELSAFQARVLHCVYGGIAALLFSLFLVYDTQMVIGGRKHELDPEEYIYGALQLYLDVVYIFLIILALFGSSD